MTANSPSSRVRNAHESYQPQHSMERHYRMDGRRRPLSATSPYATRCRNEHKKSATPVPSKLSASTSHYAIAPSMGCGEERAKRTGARFADSEVDQYQLDPTITSPRAYRTGSRCTRAVSIPPRDGPLSGEDRLLSTTPGVCVSILRVRPGPWLMILQCESCPRRDNRIGWVVNYGRVNITEALFLLRSCPTRRN
jgi:hypothetical protein